MNSGPVEPFSVPPVRIEDVDRLHGVLEVAGIASIAIRGDGKVLRVNRHACLLTGDPRKVLLGSNWFDLRVAASDRERVRRALKQMNERGGEAITALQYSVRTADGSERDVTWRTALLRGVDGAICGTFQLALHVADASSETSSALQGVARSQADLISASSLTMIALDARGVVLLWNSAAERMFGWTAEEVIGMPNPIVPPGGHKEFASMLDNAMSGGEPNEFEAIRQAKDGRMFPVLISFAPLRDARGARYGALAIIADLSPHREAAAQLHRAEEGFRLLAEGARDYALYRLDPDGVVTTWNVGAERLKGYRAEEIVGQHFSRFYPDEDRARSLPQRLLQAAAQHGDARHEGWRMRKDGSRFWAAVIITALRGDDGALLGFAKITQDISERKAFQDTIQARAAQQEAVADLSQAALAGTSLDVLFESAATTIARCLAVERSAILEVVRGGSSLLLRAGVGWNEGVGTFVMAATREWQAGYCLRARGPVIVTDYESETRFTRSPLIRQYGVQSAITVAMRHDANLHGVVAAYADRRRTFTPDEVRFVEAVASVLTSAIRHRATDADLQRSEQRFRAQYQRMPVPTFTWQHIDGDFMLVDFNEAAHLFTDGRAAGLVGHRASDIHRERPDVVAHMQAAFDQKHFVRNEIAYDMVSTGRSYDLEVTYSFVAPDVILMYMSDMTDRKRREQQVLASREELRALSNRLLRLQEDERARIAREVHDQLGQRMTTLKFTVAALSDAVELPYRETMRVAEMYALIDDTIDVARRIASELRPSVLDDFGLVAAVQHAVEQFQTRSAVECDMSVEPPDLQVPEGVATAIYRMLQECLSNVTRHARADHVEVRLRKDDHRLVLEVRDDGVGIKAGAVASKDSLGLIGIRERAALVAGEVRFEGADGHGTIVSISVPLPKETPP